MTRRIDAMSGKEPSPQQEEQPKDSRKKLENRDQRILERLQEAQEAQAKAMERYHRAEARLQKRIARVQKVEGRLTIIRQQLEATHASSPVEEPSVAPSTAAEVADGTDGNAGLTGQASATSAAVEGATLGSST